MVDNVISEAKSRMKKSVTIVGDEFGKIRTGRASASILDRVMVDYYGTKTPLKQLANITAPDAQLLVIHPYDKNVIEEVEKGILAADLGLTPSNDGALIRLPFPALSEERRLEMVKLAKQMAEEGKVAVRQIRRELIDKFDAKKKSSEISEDDFERARKSIQNVTDEHIKEIDELFKGKEIEIMEV